VEDPPKHVLSYESNVGLKPQRWLLWGLLTILVFLMVGVLGIFSVHTQVVPSPVIMSTVVVTHSSPIRTFTVIYGPDSVDISYGRWICLRNANTCVALRITCPTGNADQISYEWIQSAPGARDFIAQPMTRGRGEINGQQIGNIIAGSFVLKWSKLSSDAGAIDWATLSGGNFEVSDWFAKSEQELAHPPADVKWFSDPGPSVVKKTINDQTVPPVDPDMRGDGQTVR
jgi:hypothetical protein